MIKKLMFVFISAIMVGYLLSLVVTKVAARKDDDHECEHRCTTPTPIVTLTPTPTITVTPTPVVINECDGDCQEEPTPTPTLEPTEAPKPISGGHENGSASAPQLPACSEIRNAPTVTSFGRIDSQSIWVEWTKVEEYVHDYVLWYGPAQDQLVWNTIVHNERAELHSLPANQHIWVQVQGTKDGCVGKPSLVVDP